MSYAGARKVITRTKDISVGFSHVFRVPLFREKTLESDSSIAWPIVIPVHAD